MPLAPAARALLISTVRASCTAGSQAEYPNREKCGHKRNAQRRGIEHRTNRQRCAHRTAVPNVYSFVIIAASTWNITYEATHPDGSEDEAFDALFPDQPPARRAKGHAHRELALPGRASCQHEIREVGTCHNQHESNEHDHRHPDSASGTIAVAVIADQPRSPCTTYGVAADCRQSRWMRIVQTRPQSSPVRLTLARR